MRRVGGGGECSFVSAAEYDQKKPMVDDRTRISFAPKTVMIVCESESERRSTGSWFVVRAV